MADDGAPDPDGPKPSRNRRVADAFAAQFDPPLTPVKTERINGIPHRDAWLIAKFDRTKGWGITAHAYAGQLHAFIEVQGDRAEVVGAAMAQWLRDAPMASE
jgi:hypothetical protein